MSYSQDLQIQYHVPQQMVVAGQPQTTVISTGPAQGGKEYTRQICF